MQDGEIYELTGPRQLVLRKEPFASGALPPDQVEAQTVFSAVSPGTEGAAYRGDPPLRPMKVYPRLVGYCNIARVLRVGDAVQGIEPGTLIYTSQSHRTGFRCPVSAVQAIVPSDTNLPAAAAAYLYHLGYAALYQGGFWPGMNVGIVGLGTLGLATAALAHQLGARVYAFSNQEEASTAALRAGVRRVFRKDLSEPRSELGRETGGTGIDLVISTSNGWDDWRLAMRIPRYKGTICVLGFPGRSEPSPGFNPLASENFYDYQLRIIGAGQLPDSSDAHLESRFSVQKNLAYLLTLIQEGRLDPMGTLVSEVTSWKNLEAVYRKVVDRTPGYCTAVLDWGI